jgi:hypothetical protein
VSHPAGFAERIHCACCSDVQIVMTWLRFHEQVFPVIAPPLIVGAAYAAYRLWSASRGAG